MKNNKRIFIFIGIILCLLIGFFVLNSEDNTKCHNISWKSDVTDTKKVLSKLDLIDSKGNKYKIKEKDFVEIDSHSFKLEVKNINLKSKDIDLLDCNANLYTIFVQYDDNMEIIDVTEKYTFLTDNSKDDYVEKEQLMKKTLSKKLETFRKYKFEDLGKMPTTVEENLFKTNKNFITVSTDFLDFERFNIDSEFNIFIDYYNPRYTEDDIISESYYDDFPENEI